MAALTSSQIAGDVRLVRAITFNSYTLLSPSLLVKTLFIGNRYMNNISQVTGVLPVHTNAVRITRMFDPQACLGFSWTMACFNFGPMALCMSWCYHESGYCMVVPARSTSCSQ
ncbi:hypothetical protein V8E55_003937 [Tylopilus felleus]